MKKFLVLSVLVVVLTSICYATECQQGQVCQDASGSYVVNEYGSKGRISAKDLELKNKGLPYGITWSASEMTQTELDARTIEQLERDAIKAIEDVQKANKESKKNSARKKLRNLNLTDDEISALIE